MARDTSNDPVVNLPLDYKFDGNGNIIQKVFFGVNAVFCPVWYWCCLLYTSAKAIASVLSNVLSVRTRFCMY